MRTKHNSNSEMPSKFVSRTFVRSEISSLQHTLEVECDMTKVKVSELQGLADDQASQLRGLQEIIDKHTSCIQQCQERLSQLVEGGVRRAAAVFKSESWARGYTIKSARDAVIMMKDYLEEDEDWAVKALENVQSLLKREDAIRRLAGLIENVIEYSEHDSWAQLRGRLVLYPIIVNDDICELHIRKLLSTAPPYLRKILKQLSMFTRPPTANGRATKAPTSPVLKCFLNDYDWLLEQELSLMALTMISKGTGYEEDEVELPVHELQFDCFGSIKRAENSDLLVEGGEVKCSVEELPEAKAQLVRRFRFIAFLLPVVAPSCVFEKALFVGYAYLAWSRKERREIEGMLQADAVITESDGFTWTLKRSFIMDLF